jgi:hypothetical protein
MGDRAPRRRPDPWIGGDKRSRTSARGRGPRLGNNLSFSLLYWLLDRGGPIMRALIVRCRPTSPSRSAFSPTDVMPLTHRAKYTTLVQSTIALALFGLIVARAVNAFT